MLGEEGSRSPSTKIYSYLASDGRQYCGSSPWSVVLWQVRVLTRQRMEKRGHLGDGYGEDAEARAVKVGGYYQVCTAQ